MASASRTEAVAPFRESSFEDRLDHEPDRLLDDAILDRRNAQRSRPAIAFRNVHSLDDLRAVRALPQRRRQLRQIELCLRRELADRLPIHARSTFVRTNLRPCDRQRSGREHLVHQTEPFAAFDPVDQGRQHPLRPHRSFGPREHGTGLCTVRSPLGHSRCCLCFSRSLHGSTFLPTFPRPGLCYPCLSRPHPGRIGPMRALTPGELAHPSGLSASFALPSEHPTPTHVACPACRFDSHLSASGRASGPGFASMQQARRNTPPYRVRHPAGCSFASDCSPPRIAATQLSSAT